MTQYRFKFGRCTITDGNGDAIGDGDTPSTLKIHLFLLDGSTSSDVVFTRSDYTDDVTIDAAGVASVTPDSAGNVTWNGGDLDSRALPSRAFELRFRGVGTADTLVTGGDTHLTVTADDIAASAVSNDQGLAAFLNRADNSSNGIVDVTATIGGFIPEVDTVL